MLVVEVRCWRKGEKELRTCESLDETRNDGQEAIPLVLGPELAIAKIPAPVNRSSG